MLGFDPNFNAACLLVMMMNHSHPEHNYDAMERAITDSIAAGADFLFDQVLFDKTILAQAAQHDLPYENLASLVRNLHVHHVKRSNGRIRKSLRTIVERYDNKTTILQLARHYNYPPVQLARLVAEQVTQCSNAECSDFIRSCHNNSPKLPQSSNLSREAQERLVDNVREALIKDPLYGPRHDHSRHLAGIEFEVVLEHKLKELGIPFESEQELRERGASKTPDTLLKIPVGIELPKQNGEVGSEWRMICWIDSKATFGDVKTHQNNIPQAESYVHRFGPGLLVYWLGHAPLHRLGENGNGDYAVADKVPTRMQLPSGAFLTKH